MSPTYLFSGNLPFRKKALFIPKEISLNYKYIEIITSLPKLQIPSLPSFNNTCIILKAQIPEIDSIIALVSLTRDIKN
jgi:hypothetical protein